MPARHCWPRSRARQLANVLPSGRIRSDDAATRASASHPEAARATGVPQHRSSARPRTPRPCSCRRARRATATAGYCSTRFSSSNHASQRRTVSPRPVANALCAFSSMSRLTRSTSTRRLRVVDRRVGHLVRLAPLGGADMKRTDDLWLTTLQLGAQQVAEEMVVSVPLAVPIECDEQQVRVRERLQHRARAGGVEHRVAQRPAQAIEDGRSRQEPDLGVREAREQLGPQVVRHQPVVAGERELPRGLATRRPATPARRGTSRRAIPRFARAGGPARRR